MFERIKLPYDYADLEPHIDAETMRTHYDKHHKTYTDRFNDAVSKAGLENKSAAEILMNLRDVPEEHRNALRNNGGGFYNHNLYFESMCKGGKKPSGKLEKMIKEQYGNLDALQEKLDKVGTADLFGSGWAWLILKDGKLDICHTSNQESPLEAKNPNILLPIDMWEHAYYLKYKNEKKEYVKNYFKVVDWEKVGERLEKAL